MGFLSRRFYYGWVILAITALTLLISAGVRSVPTLFIKPLEHDLGWSLPTISLAISIGLFLYGLAAPGAGWLIDRFGPRLLMLAGLLMISLATALSAALSELWQLYLLWGVFSGVGTGIVATVLGAAVANRWFVRHRGLALGLIGAGGSAGQLIFLPLLTAWIGAFGWRITSLILAGVVLTILLPVLLFMRDDPAELGLVPLGSVPAPAGVVEVAPNTRAVLGRAIRSREFWLLAGSFFVCGATTNGLIGTHLIPHSVDHGIPAGTAAGALALMGAMNFVGTIASGWLTDRFDPRKLLAIYYTLRGLSLFLLPFVGDFSGLAIFAVFYGLDYIATVPPTVTLVGEVFGRKNVGTIFGWVFFAHQVGAALTAYLGGVARSALGDYQMAFLLAGAFAIVGGGLALSVGRRSVSVAAPAVAPA